MLSKLIIQVAASIIMFNYFLFNPTVVVILIESKSQIRSREVKKLNLETVYSKIMSFFCGFVINSQPLLVMTTSSSIVETP